MKLPWRKTSRKETTVEITYPRWWGLWLKVEKNLPIGKAFLLLGIKLLVISHSNNSINAKDIRYFKAPAITCIYVTKGEFKTITFFEETWAMLLGEVEKQCKSQYQQS